VPTYSYRCTECGEAFDIVQAFTDDTLTVCPNCGGVLRKVFSPVGVSFSGSGFYRTDSRAAENKKKDAAASAPSSDSSSSADSSGSAKADGAKADGAKSDAAKSDAAKSDSKAPATSTSSPSAKPEKKSAAKKNG
jgi:putative FmdB family regulatory protein